jgi:multiple sugar transport system substrate-binding protein
MNHSSGTAQSFVPQRPKKKLWRRSLGATALAALATLATTGGNALSSPLQPHSPLAPGEISSQSGSLTVWSYYTGAQVTMLDDETKLFNEQYPNVKVTSVFIPGTELDPKLLAAAAAKTGPDVVVNNPAGDFPELSAAGALADMTPYWDSFAGKTQFPSSVEWKSNGHLMTVQSYVNVLGMWYNKTLLDKLGLKPATSVAQLEKQLPIIKAHGDIGLMMAMQSGVAEWSAWPWLNDFGGKGFCSLGSPGTVQALSLLSSWERSGYIPNSALQWNQDPSNSGFYDGNMAYMEDGNWIQTELAGAHLKFSFADETMPAGPGGSHVQLGGEGQAIGGFSKNKALAWAYLQDGFYSKAGDLLTFTESGSIPTRKDVAVVLKSHPWVQAFTSAAATAMPGLDNKNVSAAETPLNDDISTMMGGGSSPQSTAVNVGKAVKAALIGGPCT